MCCFFAVLLSTLQAAWELPTILLSLPPASLQASRDILLLTFYMRYWDRPVQKSTFTH